MEQRVAASWEGGEWKEPWWKDGEEKQLHNKKWWYRWDKQSWPNKYESCASWENERPWQQDWNHHGQSWSRQHEDSVHVCGEASSARGGYHHDRADKDGAEVRQKVYDYIRQLPKGDSFAFAESPLEMRLE